ncbi:hypothetical protein P280DRAFT_524887 [Massarina eburnea CBS 473.64]|uniref:Uncharacterized protein n=1 Tax=Massarina eburnea CBS 473.64 TaxID=1395130 RepID=A0A6A6SEG4_9PLEO|nr:hypothetical protein P280DRAFT_524887 [Massarina eburnea CBS 473.64]
MKTNAIGLLAGTTAALNHGPVMYKSLNGYTTITPGRTHTPITVTSQYQTVPTYISSASSYSDYLYVSTVIVDAESKNCTVTKTDEPITIYHSKYAITHTTTEGGYAASTGNHPIATGGYYPYHQNATASPANIGPSALPNYPGSGLCNEKCNGKGDIKYQPVHVSEYKNGKWTQYNATYTYGAPTPSATTYENPGTYTVPAYDMTVHKPTTAVAEATYTAPASKTVTYGGSSTEVFQPCTITAQYPTYSTSTEGEKITTETLILTTTIYAEKPGMYMIAKPTVTRFESEVLCRYPTLSVYQPGVYHHSRETVTVTRSSEIYTCSYHGSSTSMPASVSMTSTPSTDTPSSPSSTPYRTHTTTPCSSSKHTTPPTDSSTQPPHPDPSSDYEEPVESYGTASSGYVKRGGMLERRKAAWEKKAVLAKRVILV